MPAVAGYRIGSTSARWLVLEVAIDNPSASSGRVVASGVRLFTTTKPRTYDVGTMVLVSG
jgi:hypothetical protein